MRGVQMARRGKRGLIALLKSMKPIEERFPEIDDPMPRGRRFFDHSAEFDAVARTQVVRSAPVLPAIRKEYPQIAIDLAHAQRQVVVSPAKTCSRSCHSQSISAQ
jgi:hypothetical protein